MKQIKVLLMSVVGITVVTGVLSTLFAQGQGNQGNSEVQAGLSISPVVPDLRGLNRALVGRGSYLVNAVGGCTGCHTPGARWATGGNPFLGEPKVTNTVDFLGGNRPFGPVIRSRNLTPDAQGRPGGLTLELFISTIRTGIDLRNLAPVTPGPTLDLLQIMPWPEYQDLTNNDLTAIYEYLRAIPCVEGGPGQPPNRC